jgi:hypothetical protein
MIFFARGFDQGKWTKELAKLISRAGILAELVPKARVWRALWQQWIQCEPPGLSGPFFWMGKPAVLAQDGRLFAGYYLERGVQPGKGPPEQILTGDWDWHGLLGLLAEDTGRRILTELILDLPDKRRCLFINGVYGVQETRQAEILPFTEEATWQDAQRRFKDASKEHWLEIVAGVWFDMEECLSRHSPVASSPVG